MFAVAVEFFAGYDDVAMSHEPEDDFVRYTDPKLRSIMPRHIKSPKKVQKLAPKKKKPVVSSPETAPKTITNFEGAHDLATIEAFPGVIPKIPQFSAKTAMAASQASLRRIEEEEHRKRTEEALAKAAAIEVTLQTAYPTLATEAFDRIAKACSTGLRACVVTCIHEHADHLIRKLGGHLKECGYTVGQPQYREIRTEGYPRQGYEISVAW